MSSARQLWQRELDYCRQELRKAATAHERKVLQEEIDHAKEMLQQIKSGTYEEPKICHEVWVIEATD